MHQPAAFIAASASAPWISRGTARFNRLADVAPLTSSARSEIVRPPPRQRRCADPHHGGCAGTQCLLHPSPRLQASPGLNHASAFFPASSTSEAGSRSNPGRSRVEGIRAVMSGPGQRRQSHHGQRFKAPLTRPLDLSGAVVDDVAFTASITGNIEKPHVDLHLSDGAISVAGLAFDNVAGRAQADMGQAVNGNFSLTGMSGAQALEASGRIRGGEGEWRIADLNAALGKVAAQDPAPCLFRRRILDDLQRQRTAGGIAGLERGALNRRRQRSRSVKTSWSTSPAALTDLRSGVMRLDLLTFDADASGDTATLAAQARRHARRTRRHQAQRHRQRARATSGPATPRCKAPSISFRSPPPAPPSWRVAPTGWSLDTRAFRLRWPPRCNACLLPRQRLCEGLNSTGVNLRAISRLARVDADQWPL